MKVFKKGSQVAGAVLRLYSKKGWTQGVSARDKRGQMVPTTDRSAVSFCLAGAISRVADSVDFPYFSLPNDARDTLVSAIRKEVARRSSGHGYVGWNDRRGRTKEQVVKLLEKVKGQLEKEEAQMALAEKMAR